MNSSRLKNTNIVLKQQNKFNPFFYFNEKKNYICKKIEIKREFFKNSSKRKSYTAKERLRRKKYYLKKKKKIQRRRR